MSIELPPAPDTAFSVVGEIVPPEILERPMPHERRNLIRDECAFVLDRYMRRLARQESLCRRVLGRIAAAFLRRRAHHRLGFARLGDYTRERLGISGRELQSVAQTVAAMDGLPKIAAAFERGEVSWAQARILVDVATAETEEHWLSLASGRTVRALAALRKQASGGVTADDEIDDTMDGESRARFRLSCPRSVSSKWRRAVELARRMSGEELSVWQAADAIAAEGLSAAEVGVDQVGDWTAAPPWSGPEDPNERRTTPSAVDWDAIAEAIPDAVGELARDLDDRDAFTLDERMRKLLQSIARVDWQLGRLLRLFLDMRLHQLISFPSLSLYARERLGISPRKARALVYLERKTARAPELGDAYRGGDVSWARARALLPVIEERHAAAWVARAKTVTLRRLVDEVDWAVEMRDAVVGLNSIAPPPAGAVLVYPERQLCARSDRPLLDSEVAFSGPASVVALLRATVCGFAAPCLPLWRGLERLLDHVLDEWSRQPAHRDPVFARDGWRCAVPACSSRRNLHDHHIVFRSRGGDNARDNRVAVCAWHHLRGLHSGVVRASGKAPDEIHWEIGSRPPRPPLLETLTAEAVVAATSRCDA